MADFIREIVSQNKIRYKGDGYDLDLTYITPNIIAMGYPAKDFEAVYRNDGEEVVRFLDEKHAGHYLVINLCSERDYQYPPQKFHGRARTFPIADHGPPPFQMFLPFCRAVDEWLTHHPRNVVAVHCRAGKDRTGTMLAAYFLYKGMVRTAEEAVNLFAMQRTYDGRNVIIPSQRRYVKYFERLLAASGTPSYLPNASYQPTKLLITAITISANRIGFDNEVFFTIQSKASTQVYTSDVFDTSRSLDPRNGQLVMLPARPVPCSEDVKVVIFGRSMLLGKEELLRFWFNTFFIGEVQGGPQQKILAGDRKLSRPPKAGPGRNPVCLSCQSNQQYLSEGPTGSFVSVVRLTNNQHSGRKDPRGQVQAGGNCCCCRNQSSGTHSPPNSALQRVLTLRRTEMEGSDRVGPENLTVTLYFTDAA